METVEKGAVLKKKKNKVIKKKEVRRDENPVRKKKGLTYILRVMGILAVAVVIYVGASRFNTENQESIFERLDALGKSRQPYLVVMNADSSPTGAENKGKLQNIIKKTDGSIEVFDIRYNPGDPSKEAYYFFDKYEIESLPAIILCNEQGDPINIYYPPFDEEGIIDAVMKTGESSDM